MSHPIGFDEMKDIEHLWKRHWAEFLPKHFFKSTSKHVITQALTQGLDLQPTSRSILDLLKSSYRQEPNNNNGRTQFDRLIVIY